MSRKIKSFFAGIVLLLISCCSCNQPVHTVWLDDLNIKSFSDGIPSVSPKANAGNDSLKINGTYFKRGVGVQSLSVLSFFLNGKATQFMAEAGVDDGANPRAVVIFFVVGDRKILFQSKEMKRGDTPEKIKVNCEGIQRLGLLVTVQGEKVHKAYSDWAGARFLMKEGQLPETTPNTGEKYRLTPPASPSPAIHSAKVVGVRPGHPFLYTIAATGERPMLYSAGDLPKGLSLDSATGRIRGTVLKRGVYHTILTATNRLGKTNQKLRIVIGDTIALTPPMGWNGWNSWAKEIDREKVISSAKAMVSSGLSQHGWTYINIDDAWQGQRGGKYNAIQPNEKFPDFQQMVDTIHGLGLKVGLYSTPWISSYAGYTGGSSNFEDGAYPDSIRENKRAYRYIGKYGFEKEDALQMAAWGIDYLKYDWRMKVPSATRMSKALQQSGRDIVYSLSNSAPFAQAKDWAAIANSWRTGSDIRDSWTSLFLSAFTIDPWAPYAGPGHWNDPDMLIVGKVTTGTAMHPTRLTPDEQYSHVSIFSLLAAPLMIGCPIEQMDSFTLNLLSNDEVIAVDQDPLGKPARKLIDEKGVQVWVKPMEDGSYAVGLFNIDGFGTTPQSYFRWGDEKAVSYLFDFSKVGLKGKWKLRDLWRQQELGTFNGSFSTAIAHHGVILMKMTPVP